MCCIALHNEDGNVTCLVDCDEELRFTFVSCKLVCFSFVSVPVISSTLLWASLNFLFWNGFWDEVYAGSVSIEVGCSKELLEKYGVIYGSNRVKFEVVMGVGG